MGQYYWALVSKVPGLLVSSTERLNTAVAFVGFVLLLTHREYLSEAALKSWAAFSSWWAAVPIGLLLLWGLLKANYQTYVALDRSHCDAAADLLAQIAALEAERDEALSSRSAEDRGRRVEAVEALLEMIHSTFEAFAQGRAGEAAERARAAIATLRVRVEALGTRTLRESYPRVAKLVEEMKTRVGVTVTGADPLRDVRTLKETVVAELEALISQ